MLFPARRRYTASGLLLVLTAALAASMPTRSNAGEFVVADWKESSLLKKKVRAAQFLHRATFGPTIEQIDELAARMDQVGTRRALNEWIDEQFALPATKHLPLAIEMYSEDGHDGTEGDLWIQRYRYHAWYDIAMRSKDQLRQRIAWALIQILVTSDDGAGFNDRGAGPITGLPRWLGPTDYYDLMVTHADGNYRDLLEAVTYHPIMGVYLSHMRNRKTNGVRFPDENYAREIMQLFTIGLYELRPDGELKTDGNGDLIPTYDNEDIKELARVFTGLTYEPHNPDNFFWSGYDFLRPMVMYQPEHDTDPKTLLDGSTLDLKDGDAEIAATLDHLFEHPNTGPFIAYRLIQRLVKSNPSRGYIRRVARTFADNGDGVRGDIKAVVKAILTDSEAFRSVRTRTVRDGSERRVAVVPRGTDYSRLREPEVRFMSLLRSVRAESDYPTGRAMILPMQYEWLQGPYKQPSVFSFYLPSYQPPGELTRETPSRRIPNGNYVAPEFQQKNAVTSNRLMNRYIWNVLELKSPYSAGNPDYDDYRLEFNMNFRVDEELSMAAQGRPLMELVDRMDLLHCCGTMPQDYKEKMVEVVNFETGWMPGDNEWKGDYERARLSTIILSTVLSPFAAIAE